MKVCGDPMTPNNDNSSNWDHFGPSGGKSGPIS